jgi:hypothetical protein
MTGLLYPQGRIFNCNRVMHLTYCGFIAMPYLVAPFYNIWGDTWRSGSASVTNASETCGLWVRFRAPLHIFRLVCDSW